MKKIETILPPFRLEDVKNALDQTGVDEFTADAVKSCGSPEARSRVYRGTNFSIDLAPDIKMELVLADDLLPAAVGAIVNGAKCHKLRGTKIFVSNIEDATNPFSRALRESAT